ncbi:MAG: hypothetical protein U0228_09855 [Myxococcaceae bacterium]
MAKARLIVTVLSLACSGCGVVGEECGTPTKCPAGGTWAVCCPGALTGRDDCLVRRSDGTTNGGCDGSDCSAARAMAASWCATH